MPAAKILKTTRGKFSGGRFVARNPLPWNVKIGQSLKAGRKAAQAQADRTGEPVDLMVQRKKPKDRYGDTTKWVLVQTIYPKKKRNCPYKRKAASGRRTRAANKKKCANRKRTRR